MRKSSGRLAGLAMSADAKTLVGHAGGVHLQMLADRAGLAGELSHAMRRKGFIPLHPRGQVLTDLACAIVLGAVAISDVRLLEHQREVLGTTASPSTMWRVLEEAGEVQLQRIALARRGRHDHRSCRMPPPPVTSSGSDPARDLLNAYMLAALSAGPPAHHIMR